MLGSALRPGRETWFEASLLSLLILFYHTGIWNEKSIGKVFLLACLPISNQLSDFLFNVAAVLSAGEGNEISPVGFNGLPEMPLIFQG